MESLPTTTSLPESSLVVTTPNGLVPLQIAASDPTGPNYESLLTALRGLSKEEKQIIPQALRLIEIEDLVREELGALGKKLDTSLKFFDLSKYHRNILLNPGYKRKGKEFTPDWYFSKHGDTTSRIILRLASTNVLPLIKRLVHPEAAGVEKPSERETPGEGQTPGEEKSPLLEKLIKDVKCMPLHEQIALYARRWDQVGGWVEAPPASKKRRGATDQNTVCKRQVTEHLRTSQQQILSEESYNRTGALPGLASFYPEVPNPQPVALQAYDLTHNQRQEGEEREQEGEQEGEHEEQEVGGSNNFEESTTWEEWNMFSVNEFQFD
ncbi:hypothetical protein F5882DRAFT_438784 [Hyaloscypha sp. PMI_1271]|nr:hypothetical protein F5882DRAFT_438784 [Hyaloscypha sp. PMI_1271]